MFGWTGKILHINLSEKKTTTIDTAQYSDRFVGGLGIAEKIYWEKSSSELDSFHPESPLIFMTGPLAATSAPSAPRWIACGKSPSMYPEVFYHGNLGGFFAPELKRAGYDGIIIQGKASHPVFISITNERVSIEDARELWGLPNSKTSHCIREKFGEKLKLLTIGPGAERGSRIGTIATDAGGSGSRGFGSVMGSKNLKAIAVQGSGNVQEADPERLKHIRERIRKMTGKGYFHLYGTPLTAPGTEVIKKVHCHGCPQGCWRSIHRSASGKEGIRKCQTPLFYTLWDRKLHNNVTETSFDATSLVSDYSLCVIEVSFLLLWLEKCFANGIISEKDAELPLSQMGSWEFIDAFVKKISSGDGFGKILSQGVERAAEQVGKEAKQILDADRILPYGPKVFFQSALLYATEDRPPITVLHEVCNPLTKWAIWYTSKGEKSYLSTEVLRKIGEKFWGSEKAVDFSTYEGKALAAAKIQNRQYAKESLILCDFAFPVFDDASSEDHVGDPSLESDLLSAATGKTIDQQALDHAGERIFNLKRAIALREGRRERADDTLPENQFVEKQEMIADIFGIHNPELLLPGYGDEVISRKGKALDRQKFEQMKDEYYSIRGWNIKTSIPEKRTLENLELSDIAHDLQKLGIY